MTSEHWMIRMTIWIWRMLAVDRAVNKQSIILTHQYSSFTVMSSTSWLAATLSYYTVSICLIHSFLSRSLIFFSSISFSSNVRIDTISKMSLFSVVSNQKFTMILKNFDDWDEWFLIIETMIKRDKIEKFVNLIKNEFIESAKSSTSFFSTIKFDVVFSANIIENQRRDLVVLRENHKRNLRMYRKRIEALNILDLFILTFIDRTNLLYLRNKTTMFQKLLIFKKRLTSIDRIRKLEIVRRYKNLLRVFKHQQLNHWLLNWEKIYAKTIRLNILDVQNHRCLYDFLNALRTINVAFVIDKKTILNYEVQQEKKSSFILDFLKEFRNHLRIVKTLFNQIDHTDKKANHSTFATLQDQNTDSNEKFDHKCFDNCDHSENFEFESIFIVLESNEKQYSLCLCEMSHRFMKCSYIRLCIKKSDWKSESSIVQMIKIKIVEIVDEIKLTIMRILKRDAKSAKEKKNRTNQKNRITFRSKSKILFIRLL